MEESHYKGRAGKYRRLPAGSRRDGGDTPLRSWLKGSGSQKCPKSIRVTE